MDGSSLVPAAIRRSPSGKLAVSVAEMDLGEDPNLADAVRRLCMYAIHAKVPLIATVTSGAGKRHMLINLDGVVETVAAPAPSRTDYVPVPMDLPINMGSSPTDEHTTNEWVDRYILDPSADSPEPAKRRRRFSWT